MRIARERVAPGFVASSGLIGNHANEPSGRLNVKLLGGAQQMAEA